VATNWAGNVTYAAADEQRPTSLEELRRAVAESARVRALGTGHSFSRIADTPGTLLRLDGLPREIDVDAAAGTVRVSAAVRYGDLGPVLRRHGLALPNTGSLPHISVAGAVATATHGSGTGNQVLAGSVRSLSVVTADAEVRTVRRDVDEDFDGWVVSLGRLGVVVALELDCVPDFEVAQTVVEAVDEDEVGGRLASVLGAAYSVSVFTDWAGKGRTQVWVKDRVPAQAPTELWGGRLADGPRHPIAGMPTEHTTVQMGEPGPWDERLPHFRLEFMPSSGDELQSEYFVAASHAPAAWKALCGRRETLAPVLQVSEVRAVAPDAFWLSPTRGEETVAFHFTWISYADAVARAVASVEAALAGFDARPHWGKVFRTTPARLAELYPRLGEFRELVRSVDPAAKLGNDLVDGWLGLV
jgi:xylitol oxidase